MGAACHHEGKRRPGPWGTEPLSGSPRTVESLARYIDEGSVFIAEADGVTGHAPHDHRLTGACLAHLPPPGEPERYIRAGGDGKLVASYEANGFAPAETYTAGANNDWPGQVLARRVRP
ncbi:hypothetical protein [Streptomyces sp. NPDC058307]|uniref:hypothetical protein n=1 Tax=Streptomyces sp. NPDC058307 TaxID=3346439 RepID=UPI0036EA2099